MGNKAPILPIIYGLFPLEYGKFVEVFGGSGSVLLDKPSDPFEVYNDFDRNLVNLFHCLKERTMSTIRELGFCNLNSRADFQAIKKGNSDRAASHPGNGNAYVIGGVHV